MNRGAEALDVDRFRIAGLLARGKEIGDLGVAMRLEFSEGFGFENAGSDFRLSEGGGGIVKGRGVGVLMPCLILLK